MPRDEQRHQKALMKKRSKQKDFALSQYLLLPRGELEEPYQLTFGQDGKPLYISGPHDNFQRIIKQLEKTAGKL